MGIATNGSITKSVVINDFTEGRVNCNYIEAGVKVTSPMESTIMEAARTFAYLFEEDNVPKESLTLLTEDVKEDLTKLMNAIYAEIQDITANNMSNAPESLTHEIVILPDVSPIKQKNRGIPHSYREEFQKLVKEMKAAGMIIDSKSPWSSPVRLVRKKDGTIRVCVDFRKLNNVTKKDAYPIPKIEDLFTYLATAKVFSTIDLASGYYQIKMEEESRQYTAFSCDFGFYEYTVLPMGLTNAC